MVNFWQPDAVFGANGKPQHFVNILGRVQGSVSARWRLDNGPWHPLALGPDTRRLQRPGDFNIDLPWDSLSDGAHTITVEAGGTEYPTRFTVTTGGMASHLQAAEAQIIEGQWETLPDGSRRIRETGYDRLLAVGDLALTDYEITAEVTIHAADESVHHVLPSWHSAVGLVLRFQGHSDWEGTRPFWGYTPLGILAWYSYIPELRDWRLTFMGATGRDVKFFGWQEPPRVLPHGVPLVFKGRAEGSAFSLKVWEAAHPEPDAWDITTTGTADALPSGGALLIAHHVDATFGRIGIQEL
jgi:hypothetical protein